MNRMHPKKVLQMCLLLQTRQRKHRFIACSTTKTSARFASDGKPSRGESCKDDRNLIEGDIEYIPTYDVTESFDEDLADQVRSFLDMKRRQLRLEGFD